MKKITVGLLLIGLFACQQGNEQVDNSKAVLNINTIADQYVEHLFKFIPELGAYYQAEGADNVNLTDITPEGIARSEAALDKLNEAFGTIKVSQLSKDDRITYQLLKTEFEGLINQRICRKELWSIHHMDAFYIGYQYLGKLQPVGDDANRKDTLARWAKIADYIKADMANNKQGLETGYALARPVVERVIEQMEELLALPLEENMFYGPALRDQTPAFEKAMRELVENKIMPAISSYLTFMKQEYLDQARPNLSIATIPNGPACYTAMLNAYTSLAKSPAEIFAWGEEAIAEREAMTRSLGEQIYGTDDLSAIKEAFVQDPNNYYKTKAELLEDAQGAIDRAKIKSRPYFNLYPKSDVVLEPISALEEKSGSSQYIQASDDGSTPATYIQATYPPEQQVKGVVQSTAFHETYPGHHLQVSISRELVSSHPITKYVGNSGFEEGWARYTEILADEIGLYSSDNHRLAMYMGMPTGMVVDPGIHFKNWTRDEAVAYTLLKQATMTQADAERYVDRISVLPGQMTSYGVGERFFINLRRQAEAQLGSSFDIKAFHDICLQNGSVPLEFVSAQVANYLAE